MVNVKVKVDTSDDKVDGSIDLAGATLADLSIADRMLRRYVKQLDIEMDKILDKDTKGRD